MYRDSILKDETIKQIYCDVFKNIKYKELDLFLCGGMSTRSKSSHRDILRKRIKADNINILYPEDLFMEMLNKRQYDLLTMEEVLACNSDIIVIIPESPGSFAELGAFSQNKLIAKKLLVFQHNKFKRTRSFISQGPIDYMNRRYKGSVYYFNEDMNQTAAILNKILKKRFKLYNKYSPDIIFKDINQLTGILSFSLLLMFFYDNIKLQQFEKTLKNMYNEFCSDIDNNNEKDYFKIIYHAAVKLMLKRGLIEKKDISGVSYYSLSNKGYSKAKTLLDSVELDKRTYIINRIRLNIMNDQFC